MEIDGAAPKVVPGYSTDNYTRWAIVYINGANRDKTKSWYLWLCYGGVHAAYTPAERHLQELAKKEAPSAWLSPLTNAEA